MVSPLLHQNGDRQELGAGLPQKSECMRCAIHRLVTKLGEKDSDKWRKYDKNETKVEEGIERKIGTMRKERNW